VAINDVISVRLRQAFGEDIEAFAAVARTRHDQLALARDALLILDFRDEPRRIRLARMHDDREAERRGFDSGDLGKAFTLVGGDEMPLWCCTHMRCGAARHCARQWTSWAMGS